jgi:hypothetical protein
MTLTKHIPSLPPIGCNGRGIQDSSGSRPVSLSEHSIEAQFHLLKRANVFDYLDRLPLEHEVDAFRACIERFGLPVHTTSWFYTAGTDDTLIEKNLRRTAEIGATTHNFMLYARDADNQPLDVDRIADCYLRAYDHAMTLGVEPTFELHVNCWSEDPRLVTPVALRVQRRGVPFNFTLDYSHMLFKIGNMRELEISGIRDDVASGRVVLDPFQPGNLVDEWLDLGIVRWFQFRAAVPNGPRNVWAPHDPDTNLAAIPTPPIFPMEPGEPGRGIFYPFTRPEPGEWHSEWHAYLLEPCREVARKMLRHHVTDPASRLRYITTEMITQPDYGLNAKLSLIGENAAIARFIRRTWDELTAC